MPPANAGFLHDRLPHSTLDIVDAGHFTWEDAAGQYTALVTSWWSGGYQAVALERALGLGVPSQLTARTE